MTAERSTLPGTERTLRRTARISTGRLTDISLGRRLGGDADGALSTQAAGWGSQSARNASASATTWRWVRLGATMALPWGFTVGGSGALRWTDWEGNWVPFTADADTPRRDLTRTIRLFAHNRALTLEGFSPQISVTRENRTSNAQLHDYERTFGELRFVRLF